MKKIKTLLLGLSIVVCGTVFVGCDSTPKLDTSEYTFENVPVVYELGQTFALNSNAKLKIKKQNSDQYFNVNLNTNMLQNQPNLNTPGEQTVVFVYDNHNYSIKINVNTVYESYEFINAITTYNKGDDFDLNDMQLKLKVKNYTDKYSTVDVTESMISSQPNLDVVGNQVVTVTYQGKTYTYNISVTEPQANLLRQQQIEYLAKISKALDKYNLYQYSRMKIDANSALEAKFLNNIASINPQFTKEFGTNGLSSRLDEDQHTTELYEALMNIVLTDIYGIDYYQAIFDNFVPNIKTTAQTLTQNLCTGLNINPLIKVSAVKTISTNIEQILTNVRDMDFDITVEAENILTAIANTHTDYSATAESLLDVIDAEPSQVLPILVEAFLNLPNIDVLYDISGDVVNDSDYDQYRNTIKANIINIASLLSTLNPTDFDVDEFIDNLKLYMSNITEAYSVLFEDNVCYIYKVSSRTDLMFFEGMLNIGNGYINLTTSLINLVDYIMTVGDQQPTTHSVIEKSLIMSAVAFAIPVYSTSTQQIFIEYYEEIDAFDDMYSVEDFDSYEEYMDAREEYISEVNNYYYSKMNLEQKASELNVYSLMIDLITLKNDEDIAEYISQFPELSEVSQDYMEEYGCPCVLTSILQVALNESDTQISSNANANKLITDAILDLTLLVDLYGTEAQPETTLDQAIYNVFDAFQDAKEIDSSIVIPDYVIEIGLVLFDSDIDAQDKPNEILSAQAVKDVICGYALNVVLLCFPEDYQEDETLAQSLQTAIENNYDCITSNQFNTFDLFTSVVTIYTTTCEDDLAEKYGQSADDFSTALLAIAGDLDSLVQTQNIAQTLQVLPEHLGDLAPYTEGIAQLLLSMAGEFDITNPTGSIATILQNYAMYLEPLICIPVNNVTVILFPNIDQDNLPDNLTEDFIEQSISDFLDGNLTLYKLLENYLSAVTETDNAELFGVVPVEVYENLILGFVDENQDNISVLSANKDNLVNFLTDFVATTLFNEDIPQGFENDLSDFFDSAITMICEGNVDLDELNEQFYALVFEYADEAEKTSAFVAYLVDEIFEILIAFTDEETTFAQLQALTSNAIEKAEDYEIQIPNALNIVLTILADETQTGFYDIFTSLIATALFGDNIPADFEDDLSDFISSAVTILSDSDYINFDQLYTEFNALITKYSDGFSWIPTVSDSISTALKPISMLTDIILIAIDDSSASSQKAKAHLETYIDEISAALASVVSTLIVNEEQQTAAIAEAKTIISEHLEDFINDEFDYSEFCEDIFDFCNSYCDENTKTILYSAITIATVLLGDEDVDYNELFDFIELPEGVTVNFNTLISKLSESITWDCITLSNMQELPLTNDDGEEIGKKFTFDISINVDATIIKFNGTIHVTLEFTDNIYIVG